MDRLKTARNVAIIALIGAAVFLLPGGGRAAATFEAALLAAFAFALVFLAVRLYREHHVSIHGLGDRYRAMLYGAVAVGVFVVAARARMWQTGLGELAWFVLIALVVYALVAVYRFSRTY